MFINPFIGVVIPGDVLRMSPNHHASAYAAAAPSAMRKRRAGTAPPASVNRGLF